ncbi:aminoacyl-tRNA hydrolase [Deinococcus detaillensis]|uniref:Peptidyl-tRNA hydrolase n=1 Tax=Deinococcus detaillensis TaxID=2592048 RepID=A0A553V6I9_9DEIO|nr:aminoacyl-tRNA hydrolase [Deinococcus detaillensis]TSA88068.1 aminoacyl-tRNA hydrolase [Deinococcus detaillensis]
MKLIVALGNPGSQYAQTRHNVAWQVADELARQQGAVWRAGEHAEQAEFRVLGEKVLLIKPQTFMNASGKAALPAMQFYKLSPEALLVIQDDLDSPFGLLKIKVGGRHGGQNGVRDIIRVLSTEQFARLKIGISRPPAGRDPADWVLSKWAESERPTLDELVRLGVGASLKWVTAGPKEAQAAYNNTDLRPKPEPAAQVPVSAAESEVESGPVPLSQTAQK